MHRFALFAVALAALACLSFADVGPAPSDLPSIMLHASIDGAPVPDGTTARFHCFGADGTEFTGPGGSFYCESGVCTGSFYKLNPCASNGTATFEFYHPSFSRNYTTAPPVRIERGNDYAFKVSISSSGGDAGISGEGKPQPFNPCAGLLLVLVPLPLAAIASRR